ncbi:MAG: single-stranded DNA-binding protein [Chlorobium sp.]|nr:single-stranded DNA-binding protein [Chlorobium phaeovibrioides]NQU46020.1 single-stranded DNA-binding protein [Chlorobium sp.]
MAELKMPEINGVVIAGNLTKDPVFRQTNSGGTPVVNFSIACNRRFRDSNHQWQEDVCYVGVVAWNKLAESCRDNLKKSSAVLVDGELQSRTWKAQDGASRTVVEIKARRIQFLNKRKRDGEEDHDGFIEDESHELHHEDLHEEDAGHIYEYKYLSSD